MQILALMALYALAQPNPADGVGAAPAAPEEGLPGYHSEEWSFPLAAGQRTRIALRGDGSSDLDLVLLDEQGTVVAVDEGPADLAILGVVPEHDGLYFLRVVNRGLSANRYDLSVEEAPVSLAGRALTWARDRVTTWLHLGGYWRLRALRVATAFGPGSTAERAALGLEAMTEFARAFPSPDVDEPVPELFAQDSLATCPAFGSGTCTL